MLEVKSYLSFVEKLNSCALTYMVSGSVASIMYGEPRLTHDIDLVVVLGSSDAARLIVAFSEDRFYMPPAEVINIERLREARGHFNIIDLETGFKADIYPLASRDELQLWGMENRKNYKVGDQDLYLAPPEYVIVMKLLYYKEGGSEKHLRDVRGMLVVSEKDIDLAKVVQFVEKRGLQSEWAACLSSTKC